MKQKHYFVYIMINNSGILYIGMTNNLIFRVWQHKNKTVPGFTRKYNITKLVYYETYINVWGAISREKQIKGWLRGKKLNLIKTKNPKFDDLYNEVCFS